MKIRKNRWEGRDILKTNSNKHGQETSQHPQVRKQLDSHDLDLLDDYNQFLLEHGYTDTDIEMEEPTAINQFIKERRDG